LIWFPDSQLSVSPYAACLFFFRIILTEIYFQNVIGVYRLISVIPLTKRMFRENDSFAVSYHPSTQISATN
jgi:hypothetical protein